jgi:hypothetical protein
MRSQLHFVQCSGQFWQQPRQRRLLSGRSDDKSIIWNEDIAISCIRFWHFKHNGVTATKFFVLTQKCKKVNRANDHEALDALAVAHIAHWGRRSATWAQLSPSGRHSSKWMQPRRSAQQSLGGKKRSRSAGSPQEATTSTRSRELAVMHTAPQEFREQDAGTICNQTMSLI